MEKNFEEALALLTPEICTALPQASALHIELRHQIADFEGALAASKTAMNEHPSAPGVMAAISVLAMDTDQPELAADCANKAGNHPDALTTLGALSLGEDNSALALKQFETALSINKHRPRAWVGRGLAQIASGQDSLRMEAARNIDHGAQLFDTHIGSWIAAGWAHLMMNDLPAARARFQKAMSIDAAFAESHGALAVTDIMEGKFEAGQGGLRRAIGLDKECFSAALAQVLLLQSDGKQDVAEKIFDRAINTPLDETGRTIASALVKQGLGA